MPRHRLFLFSTAVATFAFAGLLTRVSAQANYENYTFTTIAGPQESPGWYDGNGGAARFSSPFGVAVDNTGNVFLADNGNHTVRKVSPAGVVTTLAGSAGNPGSTNGFGYLARFNSPTSVAVATNGNVYVADSGNHTIRKITEAGVVTTLAGSPSLAGTNDGAGAAARFNSPRGLAVDASENVYVADYNNHTIRKITPAGVVTTLAGSPTASGTNNGTGPAAKFYGPSGVTLGTNGNVFVADTGNHTIRMVTPAGVVTTFAGLAQVSGTNNGTGSSARFYDPFSVTADTNGNLYVADTYNQTLRKVTAVGEVSSLAGLPGSAGLAEGLGSAVRFYYPTSVATDGGSNIYVADYGNQLIRKSTSTGSVSTFAGAGGGLGAVDAAGSAARFNYPSGVAVDSGTNLLIADLANQSIRKITPAGAVTTLAGLAGVTGTNNGTGSAARFNTPTGVAVSTNGNVFVADTYNHTIRGITPAGVVSNFAGLATVSGTNDGTGTAARFNFPFALAVGTNSTLFVADTWNHAIRKITTAGVVTTFAGTPTVAGTNDGPLGTARFNLPQGIATDSSGNVYVADTENRTIRKITPAGNVTTLAGSPGSPGSSDGPGSSARFYLPFGVAVDNSGNIYVSEAAYNSGAGLHTIRKITPAGVVTTLGGMPGVPGSANGSGAAARFNTPEGLAVGLDGTLYVADAVNHAIRKGYAAPPDLPVVDLPLDNPGVIRHLDVTNLTTTSWSWSIVRYPATALAQLSSTTDRNPTCTPDLADLYTIRFQGTNSQGRLAIGTIEVVGSGSIKPQINSVKLIGSNLVLTGGGGAPGAAYSVLRSTDVISPVGAWAVLPGDKFDNNGNFSFTNALNGAQNVYRIQVP